MQSHLKKTNELYKQFIDASNKLEKIEYEIGKKYIDKFNGARLKDINYQGSVEKGKAMLESYGKNYRVTPDGIIRYDFWGVVDSNVIDRYVHQRNI